MAVFCMIYGMYSSDLIPILSWDSAPCKPTSSVALLRTDVKDCGHLTVGGIKSVMWKKNCLGNFIHNKQWRKFRNVLKVHEWLLFWICILFIIYILLSR